jgi:hypothetical protein
LAQLPLQQSVLPKQAAPAVAQAHAPAEHEPEQQSPFAPQE